MSFAFVPGPTKSESTKMSFFKERKSSFFDTSFSDLNLHEKGKTCTGCLSIWCQPCHDQESQALDKVCGLLDRVEQVRSLFPSSRKLCQFFPSWKEDEFNMRHEALCLWFNVTIQLRFIISLLGRRLSHMTKDIIPWPAFAESTPAGGERSPAQSLLSRDSGSHSMEEACDPAAKRLEDQRRHRKVSPDLQTPVVRFEFDELEGSVESSDLGHSTGSSDLTSASCSHGSSDLNAAAGHKSSDHLYPPSSCLGLRRCSSDIFLEANPYR